MAASHASPRGRRLILWIVVPIAVAVILATAALLVVNIAVLPDLVARVESGIADRCRCEVRVDRARYVPLRGIVLHGVSVGRAGSEGGVSSVQLQVARLRVKVPLALVRGRNDLPDLRVPELEPWNLTFILWSVLAEADAAGVVPRKAVMDDVSIVLSARDGSFIAVAMDRLEVLHDSLSATLSITSANASDTNSGASEAVLAADIQIGYGRRTLSGELAIRALPLEFDPITAGEFSGRLSFRSVGEARIDLTGEIEFVDLTIELPTLADEPIRNLDIQYDFAATLNPHARLAPQYRGHPVFPPPEFPKGEVIFTAGALRLNQVRLSVEPVFRGLFRGPGFLGATVHLPETPVQEILESIPIAVSGTLADTKIAGALAWDLDLRVPLDAVSKMTWTADTVLSEFAVLKIDPSANVYNMNADFIHTIDVGSVDYRRTIRVPPARPASMEWMLLHSEHSARQIERIRTDARRMVTTRTQVVETPATVGEPAGASVEEAGPIPDPEYRYVYVDDLSPWIIRAVLTAEDGDFFFYGGINWVTLADAIELNIQAGEIVYGASTISMQLVKMLFLDQNRVFSRKLQELFLVYLMEHQVPVSKERILELYLNVAEFGPGVSGIYDASRYYFDKDPRDLNAGEATWLASILPSPKTYHQQFENGWIDDDWFARMISLYNIMLERGRMTPEEHAEAVGQRPEFATRP